IEVRAIHVKIPIPIEVFYRQPHGTGRLAFEIERESARATFLGESSETVIDEEIRRLEIIGDQDVLQTIAIDVGEHHRIRAQRRLELEPSFASGFAKMPLAVSVIEEVRGAKIQAALVLRFWSPGDLDALDDVAFAA